MKSAKYLHNLAVKLYEEAQLFTDGFPSEVLERTLRECKSRKLLTSETELVLLLVRTFIGDQQTIALHQAYTEVSKSLYAKNS